MKERIKLFVIIFAICLLSIACGNDSSHNNISSETNIEETTISLVRETTEEQETEEITKSLEEKISVIKKENSDLEIIEYAYNIPLDDFNSNYSNWAVVVQNNSKKVAYKNYTVRVFVYGTDGEIIEKNEKQMYLIQPGEKQAFASDGYIGGKQIDRIEISVDNGAKIDSPSENINVSDLEIYDVEEQDYGKLKIHGNIKNNSEVNGLILTTILYRRDGKIIYGDTYLNEVMNAGEDWWFDFYGDEVEMYSEYFDNYEFYPCCYGIY